MGGIATKRQLWLWLLSNEVAVSLESFDLEGLAKAEALVP